jgi:aspartyl-tRNA(Asn)/glutamyl-tRNA(Gln) amidotransferase subunit C
MAQPNLISDEQVRHVAKLSRLRLSDEQIHTYALQLSHVLAYIEKLNELDVSNVQPMAHPNDLVNRFRDDVPHAPLPVEAALLNAPDAEAPFFKVPKVLGDASSS